MMAIQPTNMARACTAKFQQVWVYVDWEPRWKFCQMFVSPYNWDHCYFYNNEWHTVDGETVYVYEGANWREYNSETDGMAIQYGNRVIREMPEVEPEVDENEWDENPPR